jgi:hypothetical protein
MFGISLNRHLKFEMECALVSNAINRMFKCPKPNATFFSPPKGYFNGEISNYTFICSEHARNNTNDDEPKKIYGSISSNQQCTCVDILIKYNWRFWLFVSVIGSICFGLFTSLKIGAFALMYIAIWILIIVPYIYSNILDRFHKKLQEEILVVIRLNAMTTKYDT